MERDLFAADLIPAAARRRPTEADFAPTRRAEAPDADRRARDREVVISIGRTPGRPAAVPAGDSTLRPWRRRERRSIFDIVSREAERAAKAAAAKGSARATR